LVYTQIGAVGGPDLKLAKVPGSTSGGARYFIFVIPIGSRYLKKFKIKEPPVLGILKIFRFKELLGFMKELAKIWWFLARYLIFFHFFRTAE
jgi:hypothetical protein